MTSVASTTTSAVEPNSRLRREAPQAPSLAIVHEKVVGESSSHLLALEFTKRDFNVTVVDSFENTESELAVSEATYCVVFITHKCFSTSKPESQRLFEKALRLCRRRSLWFVHETDVECGAPVNVRGKVDLAKFKSTASKDLASHYFPEESVPFNRNSPWRETTVDRLLKEFGEPFWNLFYHPRIAVGLTSRLASLRYCYRGIAPMREGEDFEMSLRPWTDQENGRSDEHKHVLIIHSHDALSRHAMVQDLLSVVLSKKMTSIEYYCNPRSERTLQVRTMLIDIFLQMCRGRPDMIDFVTLEYIQKGTPYFYDCCLHSGDFLRFMCDLLMCKDDADRQAGQEPQKLFCIVSGIEHLPPKEVECFLSVVIAWSKYMPSWIDLCVSMNDSISRQLQGLLDGASSRDPAECPMFLNALIRDGTNPQEVLEIDEVKEYDVSFLREVIQNKMSEAVPAELKESIDACTKIKELSTLYVQAVKATLGEEVGSRVLGILLAIREPIPFKYLQELSHCERCLSTVIELEVIMQIGFDPSDRDFDCNLDSQLVSIRSWGLKKLLMERCELVKRGHHLLTEFFSSVMGNADSNTMEESTSDCVLLHEIRDIARSNVVYHLCKGNRLTEVHSLFLSFGMLLQLVSASVVGLLADINNYYVANPRSSRSEKYDVFSSVLSVLRSNMDSLWLDPRQLPAILFDQLKRKKFGGDSSTLVRECKTFSPPEKSLFPVCSLSRQELLDDSLIYTKQNEFTIGTVCARINCDHFYIGDWVDSLDLTRPSQRDSLLAEFCAHSKTTAFEVGDPEYIFQTQCMVQSSNGSKLISGDYKGLIIWERALGPPFRCRGSLSDIRFLAISPNDEMLACICNNRKVSIMPTDPKLEIIESTNASSNSWAEYTSLVFHPKLDTVYFGFTDGKIGQLAVGDSVRFFECGSVRINALCTTDTGDELLWAASANSKIYVTNLRNESTTSFFAHDGPVLDITSHEATVASVGTDGNIKLWRCQKGKQQLTRCIQTHQGFLFAIRFLHPDVLLSVSVDHYISTWSIAAKTIVNRYGVQSRNSKAPRGRHKEEISCVGMSPNGKLLASCSVDGVLRVRLLRDGSVLKEYNHDSAVLCVVFSGDSRYMAYGCEDGHVHLVELRHTIRSSRLIELKGHKQMYDVWTIAFSKNNRWLASGGNQQSIVISTITREGLVDTQTCFVKFQVYCLAFSPKFESQLAISSPDDLFAFWEYEQGTLTCKGKSQIGFKVYCDKPVVYSPDGKYLAGITYYRTDAVDQLDVIELCLISTKPPYEVTKTITIPEARSPHFIGFNMDSSLVFVCGYLERVVSAYHVQAGNKVTYRERPGQIFPSSHCTTNCSLQSQPAADYHFEVAEYPGGSGGVGISSRNRQYGTRRDMNMALLSNDMQRMVVKSDRLVRIYEVRDQPRLGSRTKVRQ